VTIEGGAVFKYPNSTGPDAVTAFLQFNSTVTCKTSQYHPAIFTAGDDDRYGACLFNIFGNYVGDPRFAAYANPAIVAGNQFTLSNCRFFYANVAIKSSFWGSVSVTVEHSQFIACVQGISMIAAGSGSGSGSLIAQFNNCLMADVNYCLDFACFGRTLSAGFTHCTIGNASALKGPTLQTSPVAITAKNSVFANVSSLSVDSYVTIGGDYNGFYSSSLPSFGTHNPSTPGSSPFQSSDGGGNYYLKSDSDFRGVGTTAIDPTVLNSLKTRATQPPVAIPFGTEVTGQLLLSPQGSAVPRYTTGPPDLGYWYDVLDYTVAGVLAEGGAITVQPGTAIAVRTQDLGANPDNPNLHLVGFIGFALQENSTFVSHGTPNAPITFATTRLVQEGPFLRGWNDNVVFLSDFEGSYYTDKPPDLSARFCNIYLTSSDILVEGGGSAPARDQIVGGNSCMFLSLKDSLVSGGNISINMPTFSSYYAPPGSMSWINNVFERVSTALMPTCFRIQEQPTLDVVNMDMPLLFYNNLMIGGFLAINPSPSSAGSWVFKDNLFDKVLFFCYSLPLADHDHNAYWLVPDEQVPALGYNRLPVNNDDGSTDGANDKVLTAAPTYQVSTFGSRYLNLTTGSPMYRTGSRTRGQAGLSHYTTQTAQTEDSAATTVNIGPHYLVAVSGSPKSSLVSGLPDYVSDADGNGIVDATEASVIPPPITAITKANNDVFHVEQNSTANLLPVLVNDTDSQGLPMSIWYPTGTIATAHGTVAPSADHLSLVYTPTPSSGYYGSDTFTYGMVNGFNHESSATATVFINNTGNHPPTANLRAVTMGQNDTTATVNLTGDNTDADGDSPLTVFSIGTPSLGTVQNLGSGQIQYTRAIAVAGRDLFTYSMTDGKGGLTIGTVQVDRSTGANHAPVAVSYSTTIWEGAFAFKLVASDQDNNPLTYTIVQQPQHGGLTGTAPNLTYTPATGYRGADHVVFKANDGTLDSVPATITINVEDSTFIPEAFAQSVLVVQNTATPILLGGRDEDDDTLWFHTEYDPNYPTQAPTHGTLSGMPPNLLYTPNDPNYTGPDSFTFWVSDGIQYCWVPATVSINVIPPPPTGLVTVNDIFQVQQGSLSTEPANTFDVIANDIDYENYPLTIDPLSPSTTPHGTIALAANSTRITYAPSDPNFFGSDSFSYVARDDHSRTANGTATVFVNKTGNNNPSAGFYSTNLDRGQVDLAINISDLLANYCSDPDVGDTITLLSFGQPKKGSAVNNGSGLIIYNRTTGKYGTDSFSYTIKDANGGYAIGTIEVAQIDSDGDGLPDDWEIAHPASGFDPDIPDSLGDIEGDYLLDLAEYELHTDLDSQDNPLGLNLVPNAKLSGIVTIPLALSTEIDASANFQLYANGEMAVQSQVQKGANGLWTCTFDTTSMPNGVYFLQLAYIHPQDDLPLLDEYSLFYYETIPAVQVSVSNDIWFPEGWAAAGSAIYLRPRTVHKWGTWSAQVYDDQNNLVASVNGTVDAHGDFFSLGASEPGISVDLSGGGSQSSSFFTVALMAESAEDSGPPSSAGTGKKIFVEPPWASDGKWAIGYMPIFTPDTQSDLDVKEMMGNVVNRIFESPYGPESVLFTTQQVDGPTPLRLNSAARWATLRAALYDNRCRNLYYFGHFDGKNIGGTSNPMISIGIENLRDVILTNWANNLKWGTNLHPYRFVFIDGCNSANSDLPTVFGIPKMRMSAADMLKRNLVPRAFVGWDSLKIVGFGGNVNAPQLGFIKKFFELWSQNNPNKGGPYILQDALDDAFKLNPVESKPVIYGCTNLFFQ